MLQTLSYRLICYSQNCWIVFVCKILENRIRTQVNIFSLPWVSTILSIRNRWKYPLFCMVKPVVSWHIQGFLLTEIVLDSFLFWLVCVSNFFCWQNDLNLSVDVFWVNGLNIVSFSVEYRRMECGGASWWVWPERGFLENSLMDVCGNVALLDLIIWVLFDLAFGVAHLRLSLGNKLQKIYLFS